LHVETDRGRASFELQRPTEGELSDYLQPILDRMRAGGDRPPAR
jgi:hypothetical protein